MNKEACRCWTSIDGYSDPVTYELLYKFIRFRIRNQEKHKRRIGRVLCF